jgi:hypothetical protein
MYLRPCGALQKLDVLIHAVSDSIIWAGWRPSKYFKEFSELDPAMLSEQKGLQ